jgi:hypothetical protein
MPTVLAEGHVTSGVVSLVPVMTTRRLARPTAGRTATVCDAQPVEVDTV